MKILKTILAVALLSLTATTATAQEAEYQFKPHFYIDLQGGAQWTVGETKFKDLISPNIQGAIGYQFSKVIGARLAVNGWQSKGGFPGNINYKWKYIAPGIDITFNLSNLIAGWNPKRFFNVSAFLGGGANIGWGNQEMNDLAARGYTARYLWDGTKVRPYGRVGLQLGFRLSDYVNLLLEANANGLSDKYNSKYGNNMDKYFNALAGLRINLGKGYKAIEKPAPEPEPTYVEPTPAPKPVVEPAPAPKTEAVKVEPMRREVFFLINKTTIRESEASKIKDIADYLKANKNAKVNIVGYADAGTGNDRINDRLAQQRADVVVKCLLEKFEIAADRISYDSKGAHVQPFTENDKNRVTIMIAE